MNPPYSFIWAYSFNWNLRVDILLKKLCSKGRAVYTVLQINLIDCKFFGSTGEPLAFQTFDQSQWSLVVICILIG